MIRILSDSTCDLSKEIIERYRIEIIPLHIVLGTEEYKDGVNLQSDEIYAWCEKNQEAPKTSAISYKNAVEVMKPIAEKGDDIIAFCISDTMSNSKNVMQMAADEMKGSSKIKVINSENLSTGIGLLVCYAGDLIKEGNDFETVCKKVEDTRKYVRASFVVDTMDYLYKGGRCSGIAAVAGTMLKIHPSIKVMDGKMIVGKKYRGKPNRAILNYVEDMEEDLLKADPRRVFITHSGRIDESVLDIETYIESLHHFNEILITRAGGVISSHCGPGSLGVLFVDSRE